jgi:hypothetical protein
MATLAALASCEAGQIVGGSAPATSHGDASTEDDDIAAGNDAGDDPSPSASPDAPSSFGCSGAGLAAFADRLVDAARTSCTSQGTGVVTTSNYECLRDPIYALAPPFPSEAFDRVTYWAQYGNNFSGRTTLFQCVDFAFVVTAGVCGQPLNAGDARIDENMDIPGFGYMAATQGEGRPGDVLVMDGHIAITVEAIGRSTIRVAEANYLSSNGSMPTTFDDTGVVSNTRLDSVDEGWILGWYRKD